MQRRTLFKGAIAAGVVAAAGGALWLPSGRAPAALTLEGLALAVEGLKLQSWASVRGWQPAQVFNHCAQSVELSISGYPQLKPAWFRGSIGPAALAVFQSRGAMQHDRGEPIPGAGPIDLPNSQQAALLRLEVAVAALSRHPGQLQPHFAYGELDHQRYIAAHALHLYHHMELLRPA
jgi:hypothetical protein